MTGFGTWVCVLELDLTDQETTQLVHDLHQRLGNKVRTTTKERWLLEAERAPVPPMGRRLTGYPGLPTARGYRGVGARAPQ